MDGNADDSIHYYYYYFTLLVIFYSTVAAEYRTKQVIPDSQYIVKCVKTHYVIELSMPHKTFLFHVTNSIKLFNERREGRRTCNNSACTVPRYQFMLYA